VAGSVAVTGLAERSRDYLAMRRALGYKLEGEGRLLASFVAFAEHAGATTITTELAVAWTNQTTAAGAAYRSRRMRAVRSFARHLQALDPDTEAPPADLFPAGKYRPTPYIYTHAEIARLMTGAHALTPALRAATFETLIGLLATTGMRIGEAMNLDRDDIDWPNRRLSVRDSKNGKSRELLLHPTTIEALARYAAQRDALSPDTGAASFFVSTRGTRLSHPLIYPAFRELLAAAGLGEVTTPGRPVVHGLRHSFAVTTLLEWSADGGDVSVRMPLLSTWLGHSGPVGTYWYLSAVPALMAIAAARLDTAEAARR
jgi:integrase/recombinase XerD